MNNKEEKNKFLVLKGMCGLGNRIMCLANAIEYCYKTNRTLYVDWTDGMYAKEGINAFFLYFELHEIASVSSPEEVKGESYYPEYAKQLALNFKLLDYFQCYHYHDLNKVVCGLIDVGSSLVHKFGTEDMFRRYFVWWWHWYAKDRSVRNKLNHHWGDVMTFGDNLPYRRKEDIVFFVDLAPDYPKNLVKRCLKLQPNIQREVDEFAERYGLHEKTVGIHIRDTDKQNSVAYDQLAEFIRKFMLEKKLERIFLATDQSKVRKFFLNQFGERLIMYDKYIPDLSSGSELGMHLWAEKNDNLELRVRMFHDAIMEMWLLAETEYLLYQGNSTFSRISNDLKEGCNCKDWQKLFKEES